MDKIADLKTEIGFHGSSPQVEEVIEIVRTVAPTDLSVLITGESGTGKELVARAIHRLSKRHNKPLISVNTGAIPEGILESELFGHERGSFTGAIGMKKGYFEAAQGGTVFLDEIGEMPLNTQVKLLRVLEESEFMRVGGTTTYPTDIRLIAATNKNLESAVKNNEFRKDLYFRLKAITIEIPPLRRRREDIPILTRIFITQFENQQGVSCKGFSPDAIEVMKEYSWPGNVRELRNFVETALVLNKGEVVTSGYINANLKLRPDSKNLPVPLNRPHDQAERELIYRTLWALKLDVDEIKHMLSDMQGRTYSKGAEPPMSMNDNQIVRNPIDKELKPTTLSAMEREMIKHSLTKFAGSRRKTARALQISERTLYRKIKEYGL
ncbi:MAG: sigma-54-dependent Fis family transcriptional regulator [Calditrichales bacterium]|nr:MAG: sigma-54-dependent Fis family transcriptional regulator [Calditrichales bacterium]